MIQLFYMIFFWVKKKTYPKSDKKGKVAYLIPVHNEEDVIYDTVKEILEKQDYPKELFDVYVVAHNCTDRSAELAREAGAKVIEFIDKDPAHAKPCYPINYGFKYLIENDLDYDFYLRVDADNRLNKEFTTLMNDAYQSGVHFGRGYESATNITQSAYTKASGLYYIYDSRISSRVRERFHIAAHVNGAGSMMSKEMMKKCGGYDTFEISDDCDFNLKRIKDGYKGHFIEDAIVYEDLPSTMKDTFARNSRMAKGVVRLIPKSLWYFLRTFKFSFIDIFCGLFLVLDSVILCTWLPIFYIYDFIYLGMVGYGQIEISGTISAAEYLNMFYQTIIIAVSCISVLFVFCGFLQALILVVTDYKKMGVNRRRDLIGGIFLYPVFSVVYIATTCIGLFSKNKWRKVARNKVLIDKK